MLIQKKDGISLCGPSQVRRKFSDGSPLFARLDSLLVHRLFVSQGRSPQKVDAGDAGCSDGGEQERPVGRRFDGCQKQSGERHDQEELYRISQF